MTNILIETKNSPYTYIYVSREYYDGECLNENRLGISDDNQIELSDNDMDDILNYVMDDDAVGQMVYEGIESRILAYDK